MAELDTLIIGGGITGSALLHWLTSAGEDVLLLEAGDRLGGVIHSYRTPEGALAEAGPNSTQLNSEPLRQLIDELGLGAAMMTADARAAKRFIVRDGVMVPLPGGPLGFLKTPLWSAGAKLRLLKEPFIAPAPADREESIAEFVTRRLGREFLDYAINPFVSGVYAGRPEHLSLRYAFPKLHGLEQEHGSLIRGALARRKQVKRERKDMVGAPTTGGLISFDEGMEVLPRAIQQRYADRVRLGAPVVSMEHSDGRWIVRTASESFEAARVVLAAGARPCAELLEPLDREAAAALRRIVYPPVATVLSLYRREDVEHPLDGFGALVPEVERRRVLGVIFSSTLFPNRAPEGQVALTAFIGGARQPELALLPEDRLTAMVAEELGALVGARGTPIAVETNVWPEAIPQVNLGHGELLASIERAERALPGLTVLGNFRGGVSVGDCVRNAYAHATARRAQTSQTGVQT